MFYDFIYLAKVFQLRPKVRSFRLCGDRNVLIHVLPYGTGIYNAIPNQMWHSLNMDDWRHFPLQIWFIMSIFFLWSWISWHDEVQELKYNMSRIRWYVKDNIMQLNFDRVVDKYCQEVVFFLSIFQILLQPLFRPGPNVRFASLWVLFATGYQFMRHQI